MSISKLIFPIFLLICLIGCADSSSDREATPTNAATTPAAATDAAAITPPAKPAEPAQNAEGVWHYTCPSGCAGGAGNAVACSSCGTTLAHNSAYHGTSATTPPPTINSSAVGQTAPGMLNNPNVATTGQEITVPKVEEPAQNAAGVWHYTCPSGCAGGGGSATACGSCGTTLAHNASYHQ